MEIRPLYKYQGENGAIVSPCKLPMPYTPLLRLIADEGMRLENNGRHAPVVDVEPERAGEWTEAPLPAGEAAALRAAD